MEVSNRTLVTGLATGALGGGLIASGARSFKPAAGAVAVGTLLGSLTSHALEQVGKPAISDGVIIPALGGGLLAAGAAATTVIPEGSQWVIRNRPAAITAAAGLGGALAATLAATLLFNDGART